MIVEEDGSRVLARIVIQMSRDARLVAVESHAQESDRGVDDVPFRDLIQNRGANPRDETRDWWEYPERQERRRRRVLSSSVLGASGRSPVRGCSCTDPTSSGEPRRESESERILLGIS